MPASCRHGGNITVREDARHPAISDIVCAVRGHPFVAVMSEGNSRERARMMRALGAEVVIVPQAGGSRPGQVSGEDLALVEERGS